jgi:hypothetical protein
MHSTLFGVLYGSMSILHTREHAPHLVQLSGLTLYLPHGSRLNSPKIAPTGHRYLQNGRLVSKHNKAITINPITKGALSVHSPASSSATGQAISTANFKYRNTLSPLKVRTFLGNGILYIKFCKYPEGHILPQNNLSIYHISPFSQAFHRGWYQHFYLWIHYATPRQIPICRRGTDASRLRGKRLPHPSPSTVNSLPQQGGQFNINRAMVWFHENRQGTRRKDPQTHGHWEVVSSR